MRVAIDAGHGSDTPGKRTPPFPQSVDIDGDGRIDIEKGSQYREHWAAVFVCRKLDTALRRCGFDTFAVAWDWESEKDDPNPELDERQAAIKAANCDISISVHFNAFGDGYSFNSADGFCVFISSVAAKVKDSRRLAQCIVNRLAEGTQQRNRGVLADDFALCNAAAMGTKASVLVELAFMTNYREALLMVSDAFQTECAEEICKGVCDYFGVKYLEPEEDDEMTQDKFDAMFEKAMDKWMRKNNPNYASLSDVPPYWQKDVAELLKDEIINGGTPKSVNPSDVNLNEQTLKGVIIAKRYIDQKLKK